MDGKQARHRDGRGGRRRARDGRLELGGRQGVAEVPRRDREGAFECRERWLRRRGGLPQGRRQGRAAEWGVQRRHLRGLRPEGQVRGCEEQGGDGHWEGLPRRRSGARQLPGHGRHGGDGAGHRRYRRRQLDPGGRRPHHRRRGQEEEGRHDDDVAGGSSSLLVGGLNLNGDKAKKKCVETIAKAQAAIVKEILKNSTKCQAGLDKTATLFGPLAPTCLDAGAKSSAKATTNIQKACGSLTGTDVGTCTPLPACAVSGSVTAGQSLAKTLYQQLPPPSGQVCGNGVVEGTEQCDDGSANGTPGDPCSTSCESLAETCGPGTAAGGSIIGHRVVTVSLDIPGGQRLAGVQVGFDYPQLEASIKGTGASSVVQNAVQVLQSTPTMLTLANDTD